MDAAPNKKNSCNPWPFYFLCCHVAITGIIFFQDFHIDFAAVQLIQISFIGIYALRYANWPRMTHRITENIGATAFLSGAILAMAAGAVLSPTSLPTDSTFLNGSGRSLGRLLTHIAFGLAAFDVCDQHLRKRLPRFELLYYATFSPAIIVALVFIFQWYYQGCTPDLCRHWVGTPPIFFNIRAMGFQAMWVSIFATLFLFSCARAYTPSIIAFTTISLFAAFTLLFWGGGRTTVVAALIVLFTILAYKARSRIFARIYALWVPVLTTSIIFAEKLAFSSSLGFFNRISQAERMESFNTFSSRREEMWTDGLTVWAESPWLGFGADAFTRLDVWHGHVQPHNLIIQFLLDGGIVGTLSLLGFFSLFLWRSRSVLTHPPFSPALIGLCGLSGLTLAGLTDGTFYHAQPLFMVTLCTVLVALPQQREYSASMA